MLIPFTAVPTFCPIHFAQVAVGQLEGIHIAQAELHVRVHHQLGQTSTVLEKAPGTTTWEKAKHATHSNSFSLCKLV